VTASRLEAVIEDFEDDFALPTPFVDLLFEHLSDPAALPTDLRPGIFAILTTWLHTLLIARPQQIASLLPKDATTILELWIPDPSALTLLSLIIRGSRGHAALFSGPLQTRPDTFALFYSALLRAGSSEAVLDLALSLSTYYELLIPLTPLLLDILEYAPHLTSSGFRRCFELLGRCCGDADCLSSLINSGHFAALFGFICGDATLMPPGLAVLGRIVRVLRPPAAFAFVRRLALRTIWVAALRERSEPAIRELCAIAGAVCRAGPRAVECVLGPHPPIAARLLALRGAVAFRTWRAIVAFVAFAIAHGAPENAAELAPHGAALALCEAIAEGEDDDDDAADAARAALAGLAGLVEEGVIAPERIPDREAMLELADEEPGGERIIGQFVEKIDAAAACADGR
jgi:hypothetical protein